SMLALAIARVIAATVTPENRGKWEQTVAAIERGEIKLAVYLTSSNDLVKDQGQAEPVRKWRVSVSGTFVYANQVNPLNGCALTELVGPLAIPLPSTLRGEAPEDAPKH